MEDIFILKKNFILNERVSKSEIRNCISILQNIIQNVKKYKFNKLWREYYCRDSDCIMSQTNSPNESNYFTKVIENVVFKGTKYININLELDNVSTTIYIFTNKDCINVYMSKIYRSTGFILKWNVLEDCYFRSESINYEFVDIFNPDNCDVKGNISINSKQCYLKNNGNNVIRKDKISYQRAYYYDIDLTNNRALTEFGWCNIDSNDHDTRWISKLPYDIKT
ncbi:hypothetical protein BCR32DRAFT_277410 [Anaeromyces robustus]|uniref:Uncharacterized protein n=1 Tax=Anaeromyces robustus TaxID=1754192 RepID=A0A1Y1XEH3_9FUNG|nr:hypothetical protein BCR32DRAFT_285916 [Anaeromyces robustus]ORX84135.1 hypothetical protein BCR32DRAFT_277410 [Anaeromyces robustus]|eukprot:ORX71011.1 hypothetical protein BCR32DRAFT_285916 [Anaeromyces robustus]